MTNPTYIGVREFQVSMGRDEDGSEIIRERYSVLAEYANGSRIQHEYVYVDADSCEKLAAAIRELVKGGRELRLEYWIDVDPAYGSKAYQELDNWGYFKAMEKKEEEEAEIARRFG